jgi:demethoxyubiquinone hydroxylase (CLK1/Coq7/Cat5 family)
LHVEADVANAQVHDNLTAARTIARILKVNHAGEHGAIRIYRSQIAIARWRAPDQWRLRFQPFVAKSGDFLFKLVMTTVRMVL